MIQYYDNKIFIAKKIFNVIQKLINLLHGAKMNRCVYACTLLRRYNNGSLYSYCSSDDMTTVAI